MTAPAAKQADTGAFQRLTHRLNVVGDRLPRAAFEVGDGGGGYAARSRLWKATSARATLTCRGESSMDCCMVTMNDRNTEPSAWLSLVCVRGIAHAARLTSAYGGGP